MTDTASLMDITARPEIIFSHGNGSWLNDEQGNRYLDFVQGWAVNTLGHAPQEIQKTLAEQSQKLLTPSPAFYNRPMIDCAKRLTQNSCFDQAFFANSGAEANEGAIKLARRWGQKYKSSAHKIITFENSFHGRTITTMAASGKAAFTPLFEPKTPGFIKAPFNDLDAVKALIDDDVVAIMLEPVLGEAGVIPADDDFIKGLRELADQQQCLLIFDEVQTGIGRLGELFAYQLYQVEPDIITLGKGLGGGVPIAALMAKQSCCVFEHGDQGGTYNGNPLMTAVAQTVVETVLKNEFLDSVKKHSHYLRTELETLSKNFSLGKVRGHGLLLALDTGSVDANVIVAQALQAHCLLNAPRANTLRFMPALNVGTEEIDEMISRLSGVLTAL